MMKGWGITLVIFGVGLIVVALFVGMSVDADGPYGLSSRVVNLGKMQTQTLIFSSGLASILGGIALIGFGVLVEALSQRQLPPSEEVPAIKEARVPEKSAPTIEGMAAANEHAGLSFDDTMIMVGGIVFLVLAMGAFIWLGMASG
jgi:uncharacterized membrane protein